MRTEAMKKCHFYCQVFAKKECYRKTFEFLHQISMAGVPDCLDRLEADLMALRLATEEAHENSCRRQKMTLKKL